MKEQIQALQDYFKQKLIRGEYKLLNQSNNNVALLLIDDEYKFAFWTFGASKFHQFVSTFENFMLLPELTKTEIKTALINYAPHHAERLKNIDLEAKERQLLKLQEDINEIKSLKKS